MKEKTISTAEAAQLLGVKEHDILLSIVNKELCAQKVKGEWAVNLEDLKAWLLSALNF